MIDDLLVVETVSSFAVVSVTGCEVAGDGSLVVDTEASVDSNSLVCCERADDM